MKNLIFTQQIIREGETIVAYCPELDVSSCGATTDQARANLQTAVKLFLEEAGRLGTLRDILAEAGYDPTGSELASPVIGMMWDTLPLEGLAV
jgi:predicted RNase H-like HicB family nuclease